MSLVLTLVESVNTQLKSSLPMVIPSWGRMIFLGLSLLIAGNTYGQSFSDVTAERWIGDAVAITEVSSLWADINNDGNLDLIYSGLDTLGLPISGVYVNSGSPDYQLSRLNSGGIPGLKSAAIAAGDVDNDGDIDILISGETFGGSFVTDVYKNDGSGAFSSTFDLEGTSRGAIALGDFDNDGDLDAVISGESASGIYAEVYVNNGNGRMNESQTLTGLVDGDIDLGDFDADGDLDIAICGASTLTGEDPKLLIYRQDASGNFVELSSLQGFVFADLEWADLNLDGFLELLVAGATNSDKTEAQALAYTYSSVDEAFDATNLDVKLVDARLAIGDYTNDGFSDVLITGDNIDDSTDPKPTLLLLKNGSTTNLNAALDISLEVTVDEFVWNSELAGIQRDVKWADINNDQNLDFISLTSVITAGNDTFETFVLFESVIGADGLDLEEPTNVNLTQDESTLILSWEDNANGGEISYQIGLGDEAGNYNIISPNYVPSTGTRTLAQRGQLTGPKFIEIEGLERGDYFAIVQAVGANFEISTSKEAVGSLSAPEFKEVSSESFPGGNVPTELENGDIAFADVNNDGAQDLVVAGTSTISLYLNDGSGSFTAQPGLPDVSGAQLEFGDLNLDGALDIMIFGFEGADYKWLAYQGNNAGEFSLLQSGTLDNVTEATGKLGDLNGDGSLDFILSGSIGGAPFSRLFQNTGGSFSAVPGGGIAPIANAAIALADFNKDGWIDVFLSGVGEDGDQATLYAGQGGFDFVEVKAEITALQQGNAEWGDYDSDGDLDLLLSGNTGGGVETASAAIYSPDGDGVYQASTITLPAVNNGEVKWADYNEDGFLDLLLAGRDKDSGEPSTRLFRYDQGSNSFLPSADNSLTFQGVLNGQVAWGFANNDLKIDFALLGLDAADASVFKLYLNEEESSNFTPGTPNDLTSNVGDTEISLGWNPPSGSAARVEGFSYNLYVGNTENTADISSPPANLSTDFHKIAQLGGQMGRYNLERSNFTEGTYFWGVQAVDQDFEGGEFASGTFTILGPDFTDVTESSQLSATTLTKAALAWGDYENDGDLDVFMMGESGGNPSLAFYVNQGNGTFAAKDIGISGLVNGDVAFWDLNGDRILDVIISGESGGNAQTQIFTGNDDGTFSELSSTLPGVRNSSLSLGDFDRDGDQDILIAGITQDDSRITAVYENQGNGSFEALAGLAIPGVNAAVSWIDVDDDGLLDIFVSGEGSGGAVAELHLNQGDKTFEKDNTSTLIPVINSNLDIGDIDNDGDTDLIVSGDAAGTFSTIVYENDGGSLKEKQRLTGLSDGAVAFGDLNNDRFIDAIISGQTQSGDLVTQLFINSAGTFSQSLINSDFFTGLSATAVALGDFDQDAARDLDILLAGSLPTGESLILYQNDFDASFTAPDAPSNLDFSIQGSKANLKWDEPSSSQSDGFQYNVLIEIDGEATELAPSLSDKTNGFRKIVQAGNIGQSTVTELNGLVPGQTYSFQVQSIDQAFRGSAFSSATEFTVEGLPLVEEFETVFGLPRTGFSESTLSLVDVDNDGDLDVVGIGADENGVATSFILVNTISAGTGMTRQNLPLGLKNGDISAADVDNDGDVDLFLTGDNGANPQAVLYLNNGSGQFTASTSTFAGLLGGEAEWADLDNDGDVDLVYHGNDGTDASTLVYLNQFSNGTFNPLATGFPDVESGALSLEDIDNDGWVDVLLTGSSGTELLSTVAINNGDLTFTQDTGELPGLRDASLAGGDIDNDGDMDFFISGNESLGGNTLLTELYLNNGNGDFQKSTVDFPDVSNGRILLLDIDLDGKRDLLIQGVGTANLLELWNNETLGNSISFEKNDASSSLFPALGGGSGIAIGDLNGNSTPDFLLTGISDQPGAGPEWYFLSNEGAEGNNTTPAAPEGLASSTAGSAVQLSWKDDEDGSTFNLYVGTATGQEQIKAAASNITNGTRRLVANGNVGHSSSTGISGLAPDTYYWGVQKIDQDGEGSEFSDEGTFEVEPPFFEEVTATAFESTPEGVQNGALSWGDYQNDGDLDLLVTGSRNGNPSTQLFVNDGSGVFQEVNAGLVNVEAGDAVFFDGNSDGILDLIILGNTNSNPITVYYEGAANGTFVEKQSLTGLRNSSASVRDFDRDGDPDLILAGINSAGDRLTSLFRNDDAVFEEVTDLSLPGVNANISWWDYNNDGNPDILITGSGEGGPLTALYENVGGSGAFTEVSDLGIPGVENSSVSIGDYDNDGDEDVLISGSVGAEYITRLYRNDDGTISASIGFEGLRNGSTAFGDYNHDGFLDVLLTGEDEEGETFGLLYINNNGTAFNLDLTNSPILTGVTLGQAAFADFDTDVNGTLDIVMMGTDNVNSSLSLFKNNTVAPNSSPAVPTNLSSSQQGNSLVLSWDRPSGANADGYSFNILLRDQDTGELIFSSQSAANGLRRVPEMGNAGHRTSMAISGLNLGNYEWTVQSVDQGLEGSAFAPLQTLNFIPLGAIFNPSGLAFEGVDASDVEWADLNGDNAVDIILIGENAADEKIAKVYLNDGVNSGSFSESNFDGDPGIGAGSISVGDYDNDGDIDVLIVGDDGDFSTTIFNNDGNGKLSDSNIPFEGLKNGDGVFGDYDNDGDLDVLITGESNTGPFTQLYQNTAGSFAPVSTSLPIAENSKVAFGDFDNDGDLDVVMKGVVVIGVNRGLFARVYLNDGAGDFPDVKILPSTIVTGSISLGDINNDGDLDILMTGSTAETGGQRRSTIFNNDGAANFSASNLPAGVINGEGKFADINNDGWLDAVITGEESANFSSRVYLNNGAGSLTEDGSNSVILLGLGGGSSIAFGDYNGDGKLDLFQAGLTNAPTSAESSALFTNIDLTANISPTAPGNVASSQNGIETTFSWSQLALAGEQAAGYSYNLYITTDPGGAIINPPHADISNGARRVVENGSIQETTWTINNLPAGFYNWGVQSVDQNYEGSAFVTGSFSVQDPSFEDISTLFGANRTVGMEDPAAVWIDHNQDGRLDLILAGETSNSGNTELFINTVSGFQEVITNLDDVSDATISLTDFNLDNRTDVFISGVDGANKVSQLYQGGPGSIDFTKVTTGIQGVSGGSSDWADFNLDGLPDLLLTGLDEDDQPITTIYQNLGGGVFNEISAGLTDIQDGEAKWLDYNNDLLPDIILSGASDGGGVTELFRGNGDGSFTKIGVAFSTFTRATIGIADINNDGFVDLVISGNGEGGADLAIYVNANGTTFSENAQALTEVVSSSLDLADIDEDGDVDMIVSGQIQGGNASTILYLNDGSGSFTEDIANAGTFPNVHRGVIKFADFNSDGKLDLYLAGNENVGSSNFNSFLFQNILPTTDQVPGVPTNPTSNQAGNTVNISWEAPANVDDDEEDAIRYNFYLSRNPGYGSTGLFSPLANVGSGEALVPDISNTGTGLTRSFSDLTPGTYYWGVQAIDQGLDRSTFTTEQSFTYIPAGAAFLDETPSLISGLVGGWSQAEVSTADIDNDDDLDFIISGINSSGDTEIRVYIFTGSSFVLDDDLTDGLTAVANPSIEWQDVNGDGFLDVLIAGLSSSGPVSILYENEDGDEFSQLATFLGVNASVAWGDYDNDGRSDLLLTGQSNSGPVSILYHNDGGGAFTEVTAVNLTGVQESSVLWSDINTDGYKDIVLTGNDGSAPTTLIYINDQAGNFTSIGNGGLANIKLGDIEEGDYNNDGLPDFVLAGESGATGFTPVAGVYRNNGDQTFTQVFAPTASREGSVAWGDYNNDGFKDFVVIGKESSANNTYSSRFYTNNGGTSFTEDVANSAVLPNLGDGATLSWGDLNDDDKLDLILSGRSTDVPPANIFSILTNIDANANTTLNAPTGLTASQTGTTVEVSWAAPTGVAANLIDGITYNLRIGSSSGDIDILTPLTDATTGFNRVPQSGTLGNTLNWTINGLSEGQYFWSVQAVDQDFETSAFSTESQFQVIAPDFTDASATVIPGIPANVDLRNGNIYWLDFNNDSELDFIVTGENISNPLITVFENSGGVLNQSSSVATDLIAVTNAELDAADFDKDGDLDVLITGTNASSNGLTNLYSYDQGQAKFVVETAISNVLDNVTDGDISWGDYDNDGDLDILLAGNAGTPILRLYENDGLGNFSEDDQSGVLVGIEDARIAWIDLDTDGDLDIVANGSNGTEARTYLYSNNGAGIYSNISDADILGTIQGDLAFADIENDGDLDLVISGLNFTQTTSSTTLYINDGSGDFANSGQAFMPSANGSLAFGDYNDDTFPDLIITGFSAATDSSVIYDNTNGTFALNPVNSGLFPKIGQGGVSWADYDRDGKIDLAFTGRVDASASYVLRIFENNNVNSNTTPDEPENLVVSIINDDITLNWQPPAGASNPDGLSYALYLESVSDGEYIIRPNAFIQGGNSGIRKTVSIGNVGQQSSFTISGLPAGDYSWSVQAIDQDFEGSIFAPEQTLTYQPAGLIFFDQSVNALPGNVEGLDQASLALADVNDDGFLDFVVSGEEDDGDLITEYYEFDAGDNEFDKITAISNELDNVKNGSLDWGDLNNDGLPDLVLTGDGSTNANVNPQTRLYENNGSGFTEITFGGEDVVNGDAIFGDYNNDGLQDIFITGSDGANGVSELFQNVDGSSFIEVPTNIASLTESSADWGDYNNDGFLDLALMGSGNGGPVSFIYRNNGDGTFTGINVDLADVKQGDIKWVDIDNDQDLDLIMCGEQSENGTNLTTSLYLNEGNGNFSLSGSSMTGVREGYLSLGDINQDTYPDLILTGKSGAAAESRVTEVYLNNGTGTLIQDNVNSQNILSTDNGAFVALGDVLQDRRLDLLVVGRTNAAPETKTFKLYQNITTNALTNPATPTNLIAVQEGNEIVFSWTQAGDTDQSYNLYVGSGANSQDAKSSLSVINGANEGYRKVLKSGNVGFTSTWRINSLASGTYEWGVQAIDQDLEGTAFIEGPPITYVAPDFEELQASFIAGGNLPAYSEATMAWGDFDNDEDLDLVIAGADGSVVQTRLYRNDLSNNNQFTLLGANLPGVKNGDIEWIDIENDGDLDLIITGESALSEPLTSILVNSGSSGGSFSLIPTPSIPKTINSSIAIGDINNDGAQDFVITGFSPSGRVSEVFLNRGGSFTSLNAGLTPIDEGTVAMFDADKDGKLDILLSGNSDGAGLVTELYIQTKT